MGKIHIKRNLGTRLALCGIRPDKDCFTTAELVAQQTPDVICKTCLKVFTVDNTAPSKPMGTEGGLDL